MFKSGFRIPFVAAFLSLTIGGCFCQSVQSKSCGPATEAFSSTDWRSMISAHLPFEVKFTNEQGWVGLNHVFGTKEYLQARWRAAVPFLAPAVVQSFSGSNAAAEVNNLVPVFYIQASEVGTLFPTFDLEHIRLLRLRVKQESREIPASTGITTPTFSPTVPRRFSVPITLARLSSTIIELKPRNQLTPGQYLITIGSQQNDGFEFEITCKR